MPSGMRYRFRILTTATGIGAFPMRSFVGRQSEPRRKTRKRPNTDDTDELRKERNYNFFFLCRLWFSILHFSMPP